MGRPRKPALCKLWRRAGDPDPGTTAVGTRKPQHTASFAGGCGRACLLACAVTARLGVVRRLGWTGLASLSGLCIYAPSSSACPLLGLLIAIFHHLSVLIGRRTAADEMHLPRAAIQASGTTTRPNDVSFQLEERNETPSLHRLSRRTEYYAAIVSFSPNTFWSTQQQFPRSSRTQTEHTGLTGGGCTAPTDTSRHCCYTCYNCRRRCMLHQFQEAKARRSG